VVQKSDTPISLLRQPAQTRTDSNSFFIARTRDLWCI